MSQAGGPATAPADFLQLHVSSTEHQDDEDDLHEPRIGGSSNEAWGFGARTAHSPFPPLTPPRGLSAPTIACTISPYFRECKASIKL